MSVYQWNLSEYQSKIFTHFDDRGFSSSKIRKIRLSGATNFNKREEWKFRDAKKSRITLLLAVYLWDYTPKPVEIEALNQN